MTDTPDLDPSNPATDRVNRASELLRTWPVDGLRLVQWQKRESAETAEVERGEELAVLTNSQLDRVADEVAGCAEALDTLKRWRANPKLAVREHDARLLRRQSIAWSDYQAHAPR